ncbi:hypothetical protein Tco_0660021 [Tanacetum coccineum]
MAAVNDVPQLVDKKGGSYAAIAPKLELGKFNKWKKRMLCYLARKEPYYLKCIKDGPFQPKTAKGDDKSEPLTLQISMEGLSMRTTLSKEENSDDEVDERTSEEYLRDLDIDYHERALLANSKCFIKRRNNFSGQKANENTECYKCGNKVAETFDGDEEEVSNEEEVTQVKVLMALADDELTVGKSHARNGEWFDITMRKKKVLGGELLIESSSKKNENENLFIPASMGYDQEMLPKTKDWVKRLNPDSKLPNFNSGRILVPESQAVNESLETSNTPEPSKDSEAEFLTPLPLLKIL